MTERSQATVQRSSRFLLLASTLIVLLIAATLGIYIWITRYNSCEVNAVKEASAFLVSQERTFDAQYEFTTTVSRAQLTLPVRMLEQIWLDTKTVAVPVCMQRAKEELLSYMGSVISAFRAYMAAEKDPTIKDLLHQSDTHYDKFNAELKVVSKCAPFCLPFP